MEKRLDAARSLSLAMRRALDPSLALELTVPDVQAETTPAVVLSGARIEALSGPLDLRVARERVAIVGANGAGKSTLLDVILGRRLPDEGSAACDLTRIGAIAQGATDYMLEESLLGHLATAGAAESLESAIALLGAHKFPVALAERPLASLSPGERTRAALITISPIVSARRPRTRRAYLQPRSGGPARDHQGARGLSRRPRRREPRPHVPRDDWHRPLDRGRVASAIRPKTRRAPVPALRRFWDENEPRHGAVHATGGVGREYASSALRRGTPSWPCVRPLSFTRMITLGLSVAVPRRVPAARHLTPIAVALVSGLASTGCAFFMPPLRLDAGMGRVTGHNAQSSVEDGTGELRIPFHPLSSTHSLPSDASTSGSGTFTTSATRKACSASWGSRRTRATEPSTTRASVCGRRAAAPPAGQRERRTTAGAHGLRHRRSTQRRVELVLRRRGQRRDHPHDVPQRQRVLALRWRAWRRRRGQFAVGPYMELAYDTIGPLTLRTVGWG